MSGPRPTFTREIEGAYIAVSAGVAVAVAGGGGRPGSRALRGVVLRLHGCLIGFKISFVVGLTV